MWDGSPAAQQALHFTLFTLMQASVRSEGHGVPAKGLTGTGYEGHYFWDTETYVLPFLIHTSPQVARSLLMHRVRMLPDARRRAREVGCAGALFPWRTINGEEASPYYAAGTAQYHIDADIAYALDQYVHVTGDTDLLFRHGVELLVETARMWAGPRVLLRAPRRPVRDQQGDRPGRVHHGRRQQPVHEPDGRGEPRVCRRRGRAAPRRRRPTTTTGWSDEHRPARREVRPGGAPPTRCTSPTTKRPSVHLQDDSFLDQEPWDFAGTPAETATRCCCTTTRW